MGVVKLGDVARESRLKWTKSKQDVPIVGLEHLIPDEIRFDAYDINTDCHVRSKSAYYISVHQKFINKQQCC